MLDNQTGVTMIKTRWTHRAALFAGISLIPIYPAIAQTAPQAPPPDSDVVVTGSRIEGAKTAGALPVTVLSQERIEATGSMSGDDIFRSLPQAGDVQFQEARTTGNLNDARGDNASINLRNLGTGNTLVLLNGRRLILTPGTQTENFVPVQTVNTNALPVGAIKRVEILRDGAAAIYGSDAVAGVVNIVLDDHYKGVQASGRYGFADGTDEATLSFKAGASTKSGGNIVLFGSYTRRSPLFASERDFAASEDHRAELVGTPWEGDTGFDNRSTSSPWGAFTVLGTTATIRQGTTALTSSGVFHVEPVANGVTGTADRPLRYDENPDRTIRGGLDRVTLFSTFHQPIGGGNTELYGEAGYYHASSRGQREQSAPVSSAPISIPASNYYNPFGPTTFNGIANPNRLANLVNVPTAGLALRLTNYRPVDTGPRTFTVTDDMVRGLAGLKGRWGDFRWDGAVSYSWARTDDNTHNAISNTLFQQALAKSTPDAYNPFNGGNTANFSLGDATPSDPATIRSFLVEVHRISKTSLTTGDFRVSNPNLISLWAGPIGFASGVEFRHETYQDDRDPRLDGTVTYTDSVTGINYGSDVLGASPSPDVRANRSVVAGYAELAVPFVSSDMHVPLMRSLNVQLAARDEHYSDFGNVLKPKVAALWEVFRGFSLRSSWSLSFRAPNLPQFYSTGTQVSNTRTDYAACRLNGTTCSGVSTLEVRSGNQNLQPENDENFSAGIVIQPANRLQLTVDYWSIAQKGVIGLQGAQNQILYDYLLRQTGGSNPNVVRLAPVGAQVVGDLSYVEDDYFNVAPRLFRGIDASLSYDLRGTPIGNFSLDLNASRLITFNQSPSAMQSLLIAANNVGTLGTGIAITAAGSQIQIDGNPKWRAAANFSWSLGGFSAGTLVNYVGPVFDTGTNLVNGQFHEVGSYTTTSVWMQYRFGKSSALKGLTLRAGARNVFDVEPPLYSSNYGFLGSLHSALGRFVYFEVSKKF
jgi:outer membrane receptor protein involved in Fe transport